ncbi:ATP-dependent DNA helicase RecG [Thermoproteota archaeon]
MTLTNIQFIKGVGPRLGASLNKLGIETVQDFLYFFPRAYDDRRNLPKLAELRLNEVQSCIGVIQHIDESMAKRGLSVIKCLISDGFSHISGVWFNQPFLKRVLKPGYRIYIKGKVERSSFFNELQLSVYSHEIINTDDAYAECVGRVIPVYPLGTGMHQYKMRQISREVFQRYLPLVNDSLPEVIKDKMSLMDLPKALKILHFPETREDYLKARARIVFDEFFYFQIILAQKRWQKRAQRSSFKLETCGKRIQAYLGKLPYTLTDAQKSAVEDIAKDVSSGFSMNRLIQGDVGSGKTDVAVMALLFAIESGKNGVIMAPTQILAEQHYIKFKKYLDPLGIEILLLKSKMRVKEKREVLEGIKHKQGFVLVGTHAVIQNNVEISELGLAVIDEQHRFGVIQRVNLSQKGMEPHCLYMTATPIPRSFMLTCFGDLDKTIMDQMPPGRKPPQTHFAVESGLRQVYYFCRSQIERGSQIYIVYPLIEESEKVDLKSAIEGWEFIKTQLFPDFNVGLMHGRLSSSEKAETMERFKRNEIQILVSTTVIEVGIDVPNAVVMLIHHADRFGLSQLHQLRGRIGRGSAESHCFLISKSGADKTNPRLKAMLETTDGFKIAEHDLAIRGPGEMLGTRQSGLPDFHLADLVRDERILLSSRSLAFAIINEDPLLEKQKHAFIKQHIMYDPRKYLGVRLN